MRYLHKFNLRDFLTDEMKNHFLDYRIESTKSLQNEIINTIGIAPATFFRAKKNGFTENPKVYDSLCRFFNITEPEEEDLVRIENNLNEIYTSIYLVRHQNQNKLYEETYNDYKKYKDGPLSLPLLIMLSLSANKKYFPEQDLSPLEGFEELIKSFIHKFNFEMEVLASIALFEDALHNNDLKSAITYGEMAKPYIDKAPRELQLLLYYISMNTSFFLKNYSMGVVYATKLLELQTYYFSPTIRTTVAAINITFHSMERDYKKVIELALGELVYLQYDEEHKLQYFAILSNLATAYTAEGEYEKALECTSQILNYDFDSGVKPHQLPTAKDKQRNILLVKMFALYKSGRKEEAIDIFNTMEDETNPQRKFYMEIMKDLALGGKWNIKRCEKALHEYELKNGMMGYSDIHYFLKNECISILAK